MASDWKLHLRKAQPQDCDLLYLWCNDPQCRANSLNTEHIPYEEHCRWFSEKMASNACEIYICMHGSDAVGQIRLDIEGVEGRISYFVQENCRGRGMGRQILQLLEEVMPQTLEVLYGIVKETNIASQKCFEKLGYQKEVGEEVYYYRKRIAENHES